MSRPAMQKVADLYLSDPHEWQNRTSNHWGGDRILGTALKKAGVDLTWSWPMFQGGNPAELKWDDEKQVRRLLHGRTLWCAPALSYHHLAPHEIASMWDFEQQHILRGIARAKTSSFADRGDEILYHQDVFRQHVLPNIMEDKENWTNLSPGLVPYSNRENLTLEGCRALCEAKEDCLQYALGPIGCSLATRVIMGSRAQGIKSGWMLGRIEDWMDNVKSCQGKTGWIAT